MYEFCFPYYLCHMLALKPSDEVPPCLWNSSLPLHELGDPILPEITETCLEQLLHHFDGLGEEEWIAAGRTGRCGNQ